MACPYCKSQTPDELHKPLCPLVVADLVSAPEIWLPESHWEEHPEHSSAEWAREVLGCDTRLGYVDWVNHQLEQEGQK